MRTENFNNLARRLDRKMSEYVRARDRACVCCGSSFSLENGHFRRRGLWHTRWDFKNCNAQCAACNQAHDKDQTTYAQFLVNKYGDMIISELVQKSNITRKLLMSELYDIEFEIDRRMKAFSF